MDFKKTQGPMILLDTTYQRLSLALKIDTDFQKRIKIFKANGNKKKKRKKPGAAMFILDKIEL